MIVSRGIWFLLIAGRTRLGDWGDAMCVSLDRPVYTPSRLEIRRDGASGEDTGRPHRRETSDACYRVRVWLVARVLERLAGNVQAPV